MPAMRFYLPRNGVTCIGLVEVDAGGDEIFAAEQIRKVPDRRESRASFLIKTATLPASQKIFSLRLEMCPRLHPSPAIRR